MIGKGKPSMAKQVIDRHMVRELFSQRLSCSQIARKMGCGVPAISKILKAMGLSANSIAAEAARHVTKGDKGTVPHPDMDMQLNYLSIALDRRLWQLKREGKLDASRMQLKQRLKSALWALKGEDIP
jgi:hypothetical protein